ncbi:MAG: MATE family efflux transporter [Clostridia bacterium]|nr:MATE family efflux transporter [Clostridia bacterium]
MGNEKALFSNRSLAALIGPLIVEQALAVLIGMADTMMVSSLGEAAVSSVSLVDNVNLLMIQVFSALAAGGAVIVSQYVGSRDGANACESASQLYRASFLVSLAIALPSLLFSRAILTGVFGRLEEDVLSGAMTYYALTAVSYPFLALYFSGASVFRSMGNSRVSMYASLVMNLVNVAGNALLIYVVKLGVLGAALSTLLARVLGALYLTARLYNRKNAIYIEKIWMPSFRGGLIGRILKIGVPNGLENGMFQIGKLVVMNLIASLGTAAIAANAVVSSMASVCTLPGNGVGLGMVTVVGQCMGAGRPDEAASNVKKLMAASHALMLVTCGALFFFARQVIGFYGLSPEAAQTAYGIIRFYTVWCVLIWPESFTLPSALRGAGDARFTMLTAMLSMWLCRIGLCWLFTLRFGMGLKGVWVAMIIDWAVRMAAFIIRFARGKWRSIKVI